MDTRNTQHALRVRRRTRRQVVDAATLAHIDQHAHLTPPGIDPVAVAEQFGVLVADQDARSAADLPCSPVPLLWVALAMAAGLKVDISTGRIIDGPRGHVMIIAADGTLAGEM